MDTSQQVCPLGPTDDFETDLVNVAAMLGAGATVAFTMGPPVPGIRVMLTPAHAVGWYGPPEDGVGARQLLLVVRWPHEKAIWLDQGRWHDPEVLAERLDEVTTTPAAIAIAIVLNGIETARGLDLTERIQEQRLQLQRAVNQRNEESKEQ